MKKVERVGPIFIPQVKKNQGFLQESVHTEGSIFHSQKKIPVRSEKVHSHRNEASNKNSGKADNPESQQLAVLKDIDL